MTNSEAGTRVPLFFRAPWIKTAVGVKSPALVRHLPPSPKYLSWMPLAYRWGIQVEYYMLNRTRTLRVRVDLIGHARIIYVGKSQSCMV